MKNNKGFTLIELLAVVVILITIIVIITPKVFKQLKTAENVTDKEQINAIINATQLYMNQNTNLLPEQNEMNIISLNELKESGLIKSSQILNPSTKKELTGCIVVKYEKNKYKYEYKEENDCNNVITVTFDPQGGQLDQTTKNVIPNDTYGDLPTPTREGYTFLGWNGKNIIDKSKSNIEGIRNETPFRAWATTAFDNTWILNNLKPSMQYTMSFDITCTDVPEHNANYSAGYGWFWLYDATQTGIRIGSTKYMTTGEQLHVEATFTTPSNLHDTSINYRMLAYTNRYLKNEVGVIGTMIFSNIQLEENSSATPYEPYYITSDTTVVQESNHTLKAIWQANS